ncbi:Rz-like lysis system protein LysB [Erwinia sp. 9145]|uniref:Rz-like lysis system protein LysB n=1 Tax=Erwinia sp. 9145 TaxID=1500895 RepID=UPI00054FE820|nr:Rz-like lysis system protein LysB [Erwinia sp. 9145]
MRTLVMVALLLAALGLQSWRLGNAKEQIDTQKAALKSREAQLARKNSQLMALNILTQTNSREQMRLYAAAENTAGLLQKRQRRIEELTRENEDFRRWAAAALPDTAFRLRSRPAITGGHSYRDWLSTDNPLSPAAVRTAK